MSSLEFLYSNRWTPRLLHGKVWWRWSD